ncbi:MAG: class I SAM-dependent methyltransferase [Sphingobacteriales bacterium]|nr:class I SAM-dependent methyltransferase [Sphingobacteriales bacterium]
MYTVPQLAFRYLRYWFRASNGRGHGTHSPFIYEFITRVLNDKNPYEDYSRVEALRKELRRDKRSIQVEDFGAGSVYKQMGSRKVSSIARHAAKPRKYGQLLYRMVRHYKPAVILELGTSLGITTSYLGLANPPARVITLEGSSEIAGLARQHFSGLGLSHIELIEGNFDKRLPPLLESTVAVDLAFVDGNHRMEPTLRYFEALLPHATNDSIFIFDDIHWSPEMEKAWTVIKSHPAVRCSIDLFFIGIVVFRREFREKQSFEIRY